ESVSMNIWGFHPSVFSMLEEKFSLFLSRHGNELKSEMYIPSVVFDMISEKMATVKVLKADSPWFGVTYKEDKPRVIARINQLIEAGAYPEKLF
ncbi:MAG: nucleotidyltransferase, partial [Bacteroidales bacterium]|nr:nucleotidyltransferase [Bacteroidales bacterium]